MNRYVCCQGAAARPGRSPGRGARPNKAYLLSPVGGLGQWPAPHLAGFPAMPAGHEFHEDQHQSINLLRDVAPAYGNPASYSKQIRSAAPGRRIFVAAMSDSPPPPLPPRTPNDNERRFRNIISPCEWVEDYRPGGYHPVHLGDLFFDDQYKVIRKLGEGSSSIVWLARNLKQVLQLFQVRLRRRYKLLIPS